MDVFSCFALLFEMEAWTVIGARMNQPTPLAPNPLFTLAPTTTSGHFSTFQLICAWLSGFVHYVT